MSKKFTAGNNRYGVIGLAVLLVMGLFLGLAAAYGELGFPLDDAWIHQTYARNLVQSGRWQYVPGVVSAGSTAPLWTLLLAVGYGLRLPYLLWAYLLGGLSLFWLAAAGMQVWRQLWPQWTAVDWLVGMTLVFTWPLVWAAASGMETLLFAALGLQIVALYTAPQTQAGKLGVLCGLLILIRPDGLVLLLLVGVGLGWRARQRWQEIGLFVGTAVFTLLPYFAFNWWASGAIWPNTFYAKQAEYAILLEQPLLGRVAQLLFFSWGGPAVGWRGLSSAHLLLLPGLLLAGWVSLRKDVDQRQLYRLLPLLWAGGHVFLYAWRLPVTYQHGRYLWAALPVWILYGWAGWQLILQRARHFGYWGVMGIRAARWSFALLLFIFLFLGSTAYGDDVAFIEGEMVDVAHWLAQNTVEEAVIASHDIGAIGYFAQRPLLDLAGLITPEVIPLLTDEAALSQYILTSEADYLVTAPGWPYTAVVTADGVDLRYTTNFLWTQTQGINNMSVYALPGP